MPKKTVTQQKKSAKPSESRKNRNFPKHSLEASLVVAQKVQDEMGGKPMNRLLLADALGLSPSSSNFREILSSSYKYGLTEGTEKADQISLTQDGDAATSKDAIKRLKALRNAAFNSPVFGQFFRDYGNKKVPSTEMLPKVLQSAYKVPAELTAECAELISANGRFVEIIRDIGGSPHILLDAETVRPSKETPADELEDLEPKRSGPQSGSIEQTPDASSNIPSPQLKEAPGDTNRYSSLMVRTKRPFNNCSHYSLPSKFRIRLL
jgi:hypothetical protein